MRAATALDRLKSRLYDGSAQPDGTMPKNVQGPLGTVPGAGIDTSRDLPTPAPRTLTDRQQQALMTAELIDAIRSIQQTQTEIAGRLERRGAINGVMESWAGTFPTSGIITRTYEVAVGSVRVENLSAAGVVTIVAGVAAGDTGPQAAGVGVSYVRANSAGNAPIADHSITFVGTAGDRISFEVFAGLQAYGVNS
jgi:hypothetical protein